MGLSSVIVLDVDVAIDVLPHLLLLLLLFLLLLDTALISFLQRLIGLHQLVNSVHLVKLV